MRNIFLFADVFIIFCCFSLLSTIVNNEHIQKCFLKSLCLPLLSYLLFRWLWKLLYRSWTSINDWFLKFSLTQTKRKCNSLHLAWLFKIWIEWFLLFSHFFSWHYLIFNFNEVRAEIGTWQYIFNILHIFKIIS